MMNKAISSDTSYSAWKNLYRVGGAAALAMLVIYLVELVVVITVGLPPTTVEGYFALFQNNRSVGLLRSFSLDIIATFLHGPLFIALFFALRRNLKTYSALVIAMILAFIEMAVYFTSNTVFSLLYLSDQYTTAASDAQRSMFLTAGQTMLAINNGTGLFMAFTLYAVAGLIISVIMLRSNTFSKVTAYAGIIGNVLQLGPPPGYGPAIFFKIDPILIGIGGVFLMVWLFLIARRLFQLGSGALKEEAE